MEKYLLEDENGEIQHITIEKKEKVEGLSGNNTCKIYEMLKGTLSNVDENQSLCIKEIRKDLLDNIETSKTVQHQMEIFKKLKENNIPTYSNIRINKEQQILVAPFIGNYKDKFCISGNNSSKAKDIIIKEIGGLHHRDISNLNTFIDTAKEMIEKLSNAGIKIFDDSFFYTYNCKGGMLDIMIGDLHDITIEETNNDPKKIMRIRQHNKIQFEKSLLFLHDDGVIKKGTYDTFYCQLRDLNDY
ncbi:MAG TPA: hypothetical protein P5060_01890 [Candidatus Absconditabacterales bacterium]|nr:hypothetical protein [Candidatus Absconditabacterales bacterium]